MPLRQLHRALAVIVPEGESRETIEVRVSRKLCILRVRATFDTMREMYRVTSILAVPLSACLPNSAWADESLAEWAG